METLLQDLRYALRQMQRAPGFALVTAGTLALAIGCATAVFSVVDAVLLRPLPFAQPERIVEEWAVTGAGWQQPASWPDYLDFRRGNTTFTAIAGHNESTGNLRAGDLIAPIREVSGTDSFFQVFGVQPLLGRTFQPGEDTAGHNDIAVLSFELWQSRFGGQRSVLGSKVLLDGVPTIIVGVMPANFRYPLGELEAIYVPKHLPSWQLNKRGNHFLPLVGRLKPGVTLEAAQADLEHIFRNISRDDSTEATYHVRLRRTAEATLGSASKPLNLLCVAVLGVLLIGCVNVTGLLLVRGVRRERELTVRSAIGAHRSRLVRQILTETTVLAFSGAIGGILLSAALLQIIRQLLVHSLARGGEVSLNPVVLLAAVVISVLCALLAGAYPAYRVSRLSPAQTLRSGGAAGISRTQNRLRSGLIVAQTSLALCLLVCSGLLMKQLARMSHVPLGFSPEGLLTSELYLSHPSGGTQDLDGQFYRPLLDRVRTIPGVQAAGAINMVPVMEWGSNSSISILGKPPMKDLVWVENRILLPGTLETMGAHLVQGRWLSPSLDQAGAGIHALVNEKFVKIFFNPGEPAAGRQFMWGDEKVTIVGVYSNVRQSLREGTMPEMDFPSAQVPPEYAVDTLSHMQLVVRSSLPPSAIIPQLQQVLKETDPAVPFRPVFTMDDIISRNLTLERLENWMFGIFAALALALSLIGIYGTMMHEVELRTRDIGVRMALGSTRGRVLVGVLRRVAVLMLLGLAVGWALTSALRSVIAAVVEIKGVQDGLLVAQITVALGVCGIAASIWPAYRASSTNPTNALRAE